MRFNEGISQPGDAEDANAGAHPRLKGAALRALRLGVVLQVMLIRWRWSAPYHDRLVTRQHRVLNQADGIADGRGGQYRHDADPKQQNGTFGVRHGAQIRLLRLVGFPLTGLLW